MTSLLDVKAVAALLHASRSTIWRWVKDGTLPRPVRIGRTTRWDSDEIDAVLFKKSLKKTFNEHS